MPTYKVCVNWPEVITTQVDADVDLSEARLTHMNTGYIMVSNKDIIKQMPLHRFVMGLEPGDKRQVDHINRDKKDNRRCNLRIVTSSENNRFKGPKRTCKTGLKGVTKRASGKYVAMIGIWNNGHVRVTYLGTFVTDKEAGLAYDRAAIARFADAYLNFPEYVHQSIVTSLA